MITVTPVRTGPLPTSSLPSPLISVVYPTSTPATSVIALNFPGVPSNGIPRSRARTILFSTKGVVGGCFRGSRAEDSSTSKNERSEEHTSELQSLTNLVCRLLLEKKKNKHVKNKNN